MFRKLTVLTAVAVFLGFTAIAFAAELRHTAALHGAAKDPRAYGRAVWQADARKMTLTVSVENVSSCTLAAVFIDEKLVGLMDIVDGAGTLELTSMQKAVGDVPRVHTGSIVAVYDAVTLADLSGSDLFGPCLIGVFRGK